jgi:hypothetical protein
MKFQDVSYCERERKRNTIVHDANILLPNNSCLLDASALKLKPTRNASLLLP